MLQLFITFEVKPLVGINMPREDTDNQPSDQDDERFDSFIDEKTTSNESRRKIKELLKRTIKKGTERSMTAPLSFKIDEATEKHDDSVVEEVDHDPWGKEPPTYGYQYNEEVVKKEVRLAAREFITPEGREELVGR